MDASTVELPGGGTIEIRPIEPSDKPLLRAAFARLSDESKQRRFMVVTEELTDEDLAYLTEVDHRRHEAVIALDPETGEMLGSARWFRKPGQREVAELAVVVVDDHQGRGIGSALVTAVNDRARAEGIERYHAIVSTDNVQVIAALERNGAVGREPDDEPGTIHFEAEVPGEGVGPGLAAGLRAAGRGQLRMAGAAAEWVLARLPWSRD